MVAKRVTPSPDGRRLLVIDNDCNDLHVIDIAEGREIDASRSPEMRVSNVKRSRLAKLMFSPDGHHLIVTAYAGGMAWHLDPSDYREQTANSGCQGSARHRIRAG